MDLGIESYGVFLSAGILLNLAPGTDTLYILARSGAEGRAVGVASALGISGGSIVHTMAAALGLSAVLAASPVAFDVTRYAGAAYLVFLGADRSRGTPCRTEAGPEWGSRTSCRASSR